VPSSLERLNQAYSDTTETSDSAFFHCLVSYCDLLEGDWAIRRGVEWIIRESETARRQFNTEDEALRSSFVDLRNRLVVIAPEADDSEEPRPVLELGDDLHEKVRLEERWRLTLANFDAVAGDDPEGLITPSWMDNSVSQMLGTILVGKVVELGNPPDGERVLMRAGFRQLDNELSELRRRQATAHEQWLEVAESTGYLALRQLRLVHWHLRAPVGREPDPGDALQRFMEDILIEHHGPLYELGKARRSDLGGWLLVDGKSKAVVASHEAGSRRALERLQPQLRERLGGPTFALQWWARLRQEARVALISLLVASLIGVITILAS